MLDISRDSSVTYRAAETELHTVNHSHKGDIVCWAPRELSLYLRPQLRAGSPLPPGELHLYLRPLLGEGTPGELCLCLWPLLGAGLPPPNCVLYLWPMLRVGTPPKLLPEHSPCLSASGSPLSDVSRGVETVWGGSEALSVSTAQATVGFILEMC